MHNILFICYGNLRRIVNVQILVCKCNDVSQSPSEVKEQGEADTPQDSPLRNGHNQNAMIFRGLERSQTLQVLLFITGSFSTSRTNSSVSNAG